MQIAIMTQPLGKNYGGIMQAWALQQILKRMGHEVVTMDRQLDQPNTAYQAVRFAYRAGMKAIGKRKAPISLEKHLPYILQHTRSFIDQHIIMSEPLYSTQQLRDHFDGKNYDAVIVGSDQTWRPKYSPNIYNFFLDFLEDRQILRIAYASSFGVDEWEYTEKQTKRCAELAKKFDAVSVREDSGVELSRKYLGMEATHVLDPTLLLDKEDYLQLIGPERVKEKPEGVYAYFLDKTPEKMALAKRAGEELGQSVYSSQTNYLEGFENSEVGGCVIPDIRDWLAGFAKARYVLTDSFHGCLFSIIFNVPFYAVGNKSRGVARFRSLLEQLKLGKLLVFPGRVDATFLLDHINWGQQLSELMRLSNNSKFFLRINLGS